MENFKVVITPAPEQEDVTLLLLTGQLDTATAPELERSLNSALMKRKFKLIIDLNKVDYISSAGWGIFISQIKRIRGQRGDLVLVGMNAEVTQVFELLEFNSILKSFPNVEKAVRKVFGD